MIKQSILGLGLVSSLVAQGLVYNNGTWVTNPTTNVSELQTAAPFNFFVLGFNVNNGANVRQTEEFTVNSSLTVTAIEVFFYNTNATAPSCTGVFLSLFDGNPATGTPNQLIPGAGATVNLLTTPPFVVSNTFTGTFRVTTTTLASTARQIQSVRVTLPAPIVLAPGTFHLQWSLTGSITPPTAATPFFPPITTLNVLNTGNAQQFTAGTYATLQMTAAPIPPATAGTPIPGATQGAPFCLYGFGGVPGSITNIGGGCSTATFAVKGAPTVGGHIRADLTNANPLALGAVILGGSSPGLPLPCACTLLASTDVLDPSGFLELQIPVNGSLVGVQLFTQGLELDFFSVAGLPCSIGLGVALTDAYRFQLNVN